MSEWKAGDTCQIKPCRKHATTAKKWRGLWTVAKVRDGEAMVHNGAPGVADLDQPGWGVSTWLPLGCLLPAGDAQPTRAAMLGEEVIRLRDALRWRVMAEEVPPVGVDVLGWWGDSCDWPCEVTRWDGYQWWAEGEEERYSVAAPIRWLPIPGVPDAT